MTTNGPQKDHANGRDRWNDLRVALPMLPGKQNRPSRPQASAMDVVSPSSEPGQPTIVQSSAEHTQNGDTNGAGSTVGESRALIQAGVLPFSSDMTPTQIMTHGSRYLKFGGLRDMDDVGLQLFVQMGYSEKIRSQKSSARSVFVNHYMEFFDIRDAIEATRVACDLNKTLTAQHITQAEYAAVVSNPLENSMPVHMPIGTSKYDGQVMFIVHFAGHNIDLIERSGIDKQILDLATTFGDVRVLKEATPVSSSVWQFKVEYFSIKAAECALILVPSQGCYTIKDWVIVPKRIVDLPRNDPGNAQLQNGTVAIQKSITGRTAWIVDENGNEIPQQPAYHIPKLNIDTTSAGTIEHDVPPRSRYYSEPSSATPTSLEMTIPGLRSSSFTGPLNFHPMHPKDHKRMREEELTRINPDSIAKGLDVRTTVMIRNLPNNWTCHDMKHRLDETIFGRYDFSYLRIDFNTNTNVGYCFVNCLSTDDVLAVYNAWSGHSFGYTAKKEPKICSVSYASNQGIETLVDRFRNSAIMDEFKDFRPMLWWTVDTVGNRRELIGTQRPFPDSNNHYKKQRSQDNAAQIGLYAPRSKFQHSNRAHRSQYDRGTPAQLQEEAYYNLCSGNGGHMPGNQIMAPHMVPSHGYNIVNSYNGNFGMAPATLPRTIPPPVDFNSSLGAFHGHPTTFNPAPGTPVSHLQSFGVGPGAYAGHGQHHNVNHALNPFGGGHSNNRNGNRGSNGIDGEQTPTPNGHGGHHAFGRAGDAPR